MLEKRENSRYDDLYTGKAQLDYDYHNFMNKDMDLTHQLNKQNKKLYSCFHELQNKRKSIKHKRDRMVKDALRKASISNNFIENVPKNAKRVKEVHIDDDGISVYDKIKDIKRKKLMGMKNLKDLKNLNIRKEINKRNMEFDTKNAPHLKHLDDTVNINIAQERNLLQKKVKHVRSRSFYLRNHSSKLKINLFRPQKALYQRGKHHYSHHRKLGSTKKKLQRIKAAKGIATKKTLKKKKTIEYVFNWKTLKWVVKRKLKTTLLHSLKEVKFWKQMGFTIKQHPVKLDPRENLKKKYKKGQTACALTADFSPIVNYYSTQTYYFKVIFKSNCKEYNVQKLFKIPYRYNYYIRLKFQIGSLTFYAIYGHRHGHAYGTKYYDYVKIFPQFVNTNFMPLKKDHDLLRAGLVTKKEIIKRKEISHMKFFLKYRHRYPMPSLKDSLRIHEAILKKKKWKKFEEERRRRIAAQRRKQRGRRMLKLKPKKRERMLSLVSHRSSFSLINQKPTDRSIKKMFSNKRSPSSKKSDSKDRQLYMDYGLIQHGFSKVGEDSEQVIVKSPTNAAIDMKDINKLWNSKVKITHCYLRGGLIECKL